MNDFTTDTPAPVSLPDSMPSAPSSTDEVVERNRYAARSQLAKKEDISDFAAEREDQVAAIDRGEELPQDRKSTWYRRASKALTDAANEAAGIQTNGQQPQPQQDQSAYQYQDRSQDPDYARKQGAAAERVNQYFGNDQERRQHVVDWHQALDPENKVAEWVISNESTVAGQIMERLASNPEALQQIAEMPDRQRDRWLGALEGNITAETNFKQQMAQQQQQFAAERKISKAPPPIRAPRGGSNPPSSIEALAARDNISGYVAQRRAQEKKDHRG
jgi:hypothetical protein